jgi:hypothetical protein
MQVIKHDHEPTVRRRALEQTGDRVINLEAIVLLVPAVRPGVGRLDRDLRSDVRQPAPGGAKELQELRA